MADSDGKERWLALDLLFEDFVDDVETNMDEEFNAKMQKLITLGYFPNYSYVGISNLNVLSEDFNVLWLLFLYFYLMCVSIPYNSPH